VLNQDIKRCKVKDHNRLFFVWTQRPLLKIINSIKSKLIKRLSAELGGQFEKDIQNALNNPEIQENLKEMVENNQVELLNEDGAPFLQKHLEDLKKQVENEEDSEQVDIRIESPSMNKLENAELHVQEK
jgi:sugar-specific transcriptional regulator TrmB